MIDIRQEIRRILSKHYSGAELEKKFLTHLRETKNGNTLAKKIRKFGVDEAELIYDAEVSKSKRKGTIDAYIEKYGDELGLKKYLEKNSKLSVGYSTLKRAGRTDDEILKIKSAHANKSKNTQETFKFRYGDDWKEKYNSYIDKIKETARFSIGYYKKKFECSTEEATIRRNADQARGLNYFILRGWNAEQYSDLVKRRCVRVGRNSKTQLKFSKLLYDALPEEFKSLFIGAPISKCKQIMFLENEFDVGCCIPDVVINNIIVEFDGDYWHNLPSVKRRDFIKDYLLEQQFNMIVYRVKESDFKHNNKQIIINAVNFILDNIDLSFTTRGN